MKEKFWLALVAALVILILATPLAAAAPPYYVRGDFNGWGTGDPMTETPPGSGIYTAAVVIGTAGRYEWKAANEDWSEGWPISGNAWFYTAADNQTVNFYLDQNTYDDGWWPQVNIVTTDAAPPTSWTAVGDWQGWDNLNPATAMVDAGGGIYSLVYDIPMPGTYEYKAVNTGSWDSVGSDGISINGSTLFFTTVVPDQPVHFQVNPAAGRLRVDVQDTVLINEFVFNHTGTDTNEYVEIFGDPSVDYSSYWLLEIEGDSGASLGVVDGVYNVGTTDAGGFWTTGFLSNEWENGTVTALLVRNFTGNQGDDLDTDDDGVLDVTPWDAIADDVAVNDGGVDDLTYSAVVLAPGYDGAPFAPGGASRIPNGVDTDTTDDWVRNDFDLAGIPGFPGTPDPGEALNTPGAVNETIPLINEFVFNHTGTDTNEYVEVFGSADMDYGSYWLLEIEGDSGASLGVVDGVYNVGTTDANGFWTTGFLNNEWENGTVTALLVRNFTGNQGDDLDTDDDGVLDVTPWDLIADDVAVDDGDAGDLAYSAVVLTPGYDGAPYAPGGASRIPNGVDTNTTDDWVRNDFDLAGIPGFPGTPDPGEALNTPGTFNELVMVSDLTIAKSADPTLVGYGDLVTYTLVLANGGTSAASGVMVTDTLPTAQVDFAYWIEQPMGAQEVDGTITWSGTVTVGESITFTFAVTNIETTGEVVNTAEFSHTSGGGSDDAVFSVCAFVRIHDVQGAAHNSPYEDQVVCDVPGIVTVVLYNGFYMQDPMPDGENATSEAVFVYTGGAPGVSVGDEVQVTGDVQEYYPGGFDTGNLPTTELGNVTVAVLSSGNTLPPPIVVGTGGRIPPEQVIDDDGNSSFDPDTDGLDFYESMEAMLLRVNDALVVGSNNAYGEITVVGDNGENAVLLTPRGGIVIQEDDFNPERIILDDAIVSNEPSVNVGALFTAPITGVLDYNFGNFKLLNFEALPGATGGVISETTAAAEPYQLHVASFNVLNLDPGDVQDGRFAGLANQIVNHLQSPDIIGLQEIQDNTGPTDDGVVDATQTYTTLITAIEAAGGPTYEFRDISPENNQDGGEPGANIRVGFLFRPDRGLAFVDRPGGNATTPVTVTLGADGVELSLSPGRIDPNNPAFDDSRKPLAGEFTYYGQKLIIIVNHFNSKGGDDPLFGRVQPPVFYSEVQRIQQAQVVNDFVDAILALDADANVIVMGDLNDFQFSTPISDTLAADVLTNLVNTLPVEERYSYLYDGNSEVLDQILTSDHLFDDAFVDYDAVHVNAEFAFSYSRPSDHDPVVARFLMVPFDLTASTKSVEPADSISAGEVLTYTVTLSNSGGVDAMVTITDTLPGELILVSGFDGGGLTWSGVVTAGESVHLTLVAQADPMLDADTVVFNVVTINDGANPAFDIYSPETEILVPSLTIVKEVTPDQDVALGGIVTYTITLDNAGDGTALGVLMTDVLPMALDFGGWVQQSGAVQANDAITWTGDIDGGAQVVLIFTATVTTDEAWYGQPVTNDATYTSINAGGVTNSAVFTIVEAPEVFYVYLPVVAKEH
jgi:uncharacterized repeat protein (TIGR01451 family)